MLPWMLTRCSSLMFVTNSRLPPGLRAFFDSILQGVVHEREVVEGSVTAADLAAEVANFPPRSLRLRMDIILASENRDFFMDRR